jgi:hypothetical protein
VLISVSRISMGGVRTPLIQDTKIESVRLPAFQAGVNFLRRLDA